MELMREKDLVLNEFYSVAMLKSSSNFKNIESEFNTESLLKIATHIKSELSQKGEKPLRSSLSRVPSHLGNESKEMSTLESNTQQDYLVNEPSCVVMKKE